MDEKYAQMMVFSELVRKNMEAARLSLMHSTLPNSICFVRVMVPIPLFVGLPDNTIMGATVYGMEIMPTVGLENGSMIFQTREDVERSKFFVEEATIHHD